MSICKAVVSGIVVRNPEKRFTANNLAIASFAININPGKDSGLLRVVAMGKLAETVAESVKKDDKVIVDGRLVTAVYKTNTGVEKKTLELNASAIDVMSSGGSKTAPSADSVEEPVFDFGDEFAGDDLIGDDEIPF